MCEGISGSVGEAMAAARDRATRYSSVQQDTILGYPYQVPLPDGEERQYTLPSMKHHLTGSEQVSSDIFVVQLFSTFASHVLFSFLKTHLTGLCYVAQ